MLSVGGSTGLIGPLELDGGERAFLIAVAAVMGLLIGSFLNVVVARVPDGRSVVRPPSACPHCGVPIGPRDNIPVLSWLLLRGRGRCCGQPISIRYPLVEAGTAVTFAAVSAWAGLSWLLPALLYLAAISIALALIDIEHHRLPDAITFPSYLIVAVLLVLAALAGHDPGRLVRTLAAAVLMYGLYYLLWFVYPAGMGFGDVKLAGILGGYLGFFGWGSLAAGTFLGFLAGGLGGVVLILVRRAGTKTQIPYGPYMLIGAWLGLLYGAQIGHWYLQRAGLT